MAIATLSFGWYVGYLRPLKPPMDAFVIDMSTPAHK
jgi:hypothetical protein